jgi:quercetin dioxygenase-like cupin family protein
MDTMHTTIVEIDAVEPLRVVSDVVRPLVGVDASGAYEMFVVEGPTQMGPPPHKHPWAESYIVLQGELAILVGDDQWRNVGPAHAVHVPGNVLHTFRVVAEGTRFAVVTGAGAERFFREVDAEVPALPEGFPTLLEVAGRNGLEVPAEVLAALQGG